MPKKKSKKPRPLNALWADCSCHLDDVGNRMIIVEVQQELNAKEALRLAGWLIDAWTWKTCKG